MAVQNRVRKIERNRKEAEKRRKLCHQIRNVISLPISFDFCSDWIRNEGHRHLSNLLNTIWNSIAFKIIEKGKRKRTQSILIRSIAFRNSFSFFFFRSLSHSIFTSQLFRISIFVVFLSLRASANGALTLHTVEGPRLSTDIYRLTNCFHSDNSRYAFYKQQVNTLPNIVTFLFDQLLFAVPTAIKTKNIVLFAIYCIHKYEHIIW